jgi:hypothetical protein
MKDLDIAFKISIDSSTVYDEDTRTLHITRYDVFSDPPTMEDDWTQHPIDVENIETDVIVRFTKLTATPLCIVYQAVYKGVHLRMNVWRDAATARYNGAYKKI